MTPEDQQGITSFQTDWQAATTDEQRAIASAGAEAIRAKYGFSGGTDGTQYIQLPGQATQSQGIPGAPGVPGTSANKGRDIAIWDREILSATDFAKIQEYQQLWQDDPSQRDSAARAAAEIREKYGYSGGADGSQYTPLDQFKPPTPPTIDDYESPFQDQLDKILDTIQNPPEYESKYGDLIDQQISNIINRPKFEYNPDTDPAYQAFMQKALRAGDKAYNDNLAGMSAMTGGRPNSWAGSVASQARNEYVLQAQEAVIHFEERAYGRYKDETADMYNLVNLLNSQDEIAYSRFRDTMTDTKDFANLLLQLDDREFEKYKYKAENQWRTFEAEYKSYSDALEFKKDKVAEAIDRTNLLGYVNNQDAITLGVKVGTLSQAARERAEAMEDYLEKSKIDLDKELQLVETHHKNDLTIMDAKEEMEVRMMGREEQRDYRMMDREEQQWYRKLDAEERRDYRMMSAEEQMSYRSMNAQANVADGGWASGDVASGNYSKGTSSQFVNQNLKVQTPMTAAQVDSWISSKAPKGSLMLGKGAAFIQASQESGLDVRYLVAHAAHETGWGTSNIAKKKGNMFGIGAFDSSPMASAYKYGDATAGIIGGANWIAKNYTNKGQDTLQKMRHNNGTHEYATDKQWHTRIANIMAGAPGGSGPAGGARSGASSGTSSGTSSKTSSKPTTISEGNKMNSLVSNYDKTIKSKEFASMNTKGKYDSINKITDNIIRDYKSGALGPNGEWIAEEALGKIRNTQSYKKYVSEYERSKGYGTYYSQQTNAVYKPTKKPKVKNDKISTDRYKPGQKR